MVQKRSSQSLADYPPILRGELEALDLVASSASNLCGYYHELVQAVIADDKELAQAALGLIFDGPPIGVTPGWNQEYERIEFLIDGVSEPTKLELPKPKGLRSPGELPDWMTMEVETRLYVLDQHGWKDTFDSAHEAVLSVGMYLRSAIRVAGLWNRVEDIGQPISDAQWESLKQSMATLAKNDFSNLRKKVEQEKTAAKLYVRAIQATAIPNPAPSPDDEEIAQSVKRPPENAFKAWRLRDLTGINVQTKIAAELEKQGVTATQGQVSRWLTQVEEYLEAGNVLPTIDPLTSQPKSIDPNILDMGKRQDGRTPRQRDQRNPD